MSNDNYFDAAKEQEKESAEKTLNSTTLQTVFCISNNIQIVLRNIKEIT